MGAYDLTQRRTVGDFLSRLTARRTAQGGEVFVERRGERMTLNAAWDLAIDAGMLDDAVWVDDGVTYAVAVVADGEGEIVFRVLEGEIAEKAREELELAEMRREVREVFAEERRKARQRTICARDLLSLYDGE